MSLLKKIKDIQGTPSSKESIKKFGGVKYPEGSPGAQHALSKKMDNFKREQNDRKLARKITGSPFSGHEDTIKNFSKNIKK